MASTAEITTLRQARILLDALCDSYSATRIDIALSLAGAAIGSASGEHIHTFEQLGEYTKDTPQLRLCGDAVYRIALEHDGSAAKLLSTASDFSPFELGLIFEAALLEDTRKKEGAVFTPGWLAKEIVAGACLAPDSAPVLDPACGAGIFLLSAFQHLVSVRGMLPLEAIQSLYGIDRDERAVEVARAALLIAFMRFKGSNDIADAAKYLSRTIIHADSLLDLESLGSEEKDLVSHMPLVSWSKLWPEIRAAGGFGAVVGNPPYGLSRGEQISTLEKRLLQRKYAPYVSGKMNKYLLFMARGFELLRPGGCLSLVVPNSWLGISNAIAMRTLFLSMLESLDIFHEAVFENPSVEVVTFLARKGSNSTEFLIRHRGHHSLPPFQTDTVSKALCMNSPNAAIPASWNSKADAFLKAVESDTFSLGSAESPFIPMISLQAYAEGKGTPPQTAEITKKRVYDRLEPDAGDVYPYLQGADIGRYEIAWSGGYLKYGPWLAEPQLLSRFSRPRLVVREILAAAPYVVSAAYIDHTALYNKSILNIIAKESASRAHLLALLGVLNSRTASLYFAYRGKKTQRRLFPKLLNGDLKDFPLPRSLLGEPQSLARLVEQRMQAGSDSKVLDEEIEAVVMKMYGVLESPEFPPQMQKLRRTR